MIPGPYKYYASELVNGTPTWVIDSECTNAIAFMCYANKEQRDKEEDQAKAFAALPDLVSALKETLFRLTLLSNSNRGKTMDWVAACKAQDALEKAGIKV